MSGFAVIYEKTNVTSDPNLFNKVMERLSHRGPDGSDVLVTRNIRMGHWHFWTTPEEVGECQPLGLNGLPLKIVLDGRIDNRAELFSKLGVTHPEGNNLSDAALILRAYARWGTSCFTHFIGAYALVIFDEQRNEVICVRDHLGDRTLFYAIDQNHVIIASEPWAVAGAVQAPPRINEQAVAYYFAQKKPEDGQTFFENIDEVLPAHIFIANGAGERHLRYWEPDASNKVRCKSDKEYAELFISILNESVKSRLRSSHPLGILMSGGLDSPAVAGLAAKLLAPSALTTISFVFNDLPECDEKVRIDAMKDKWKLRSLQIPCDDAWPYKDWEHSPSEPNEPGISVYHHIRDRIYARAQAEGIRIMLTGMAGDSLYLAGKEWLSDLVLERKWLEALKGIYDQVEKRSFRHAASMGHFRSAARRIIEAALPALKNVHRRATVAPWLTPFSAEAVQKGTPLKYAPALQRHAVMLGAWNAYGISREIFTSSRKAIEFRHPYRDRRLVEFVLSLPAYQLYGQGLYKHILRMGTEDILPAMIRDQRYATSLEPLYRRGIAHEKEIVQTCLEKTNASWRKFVQSSWIMKNWEPTSKNRNQSSISIPWLCLSYEKWSQAFV